MKFLVDLHEDSNLRSIYLLLDALHAKVRKSRAVIVLISHEKLYFVWCLNR